MKNKIKVYYFKKANKSAIIYKNECGQSVLYYVDIIAFEYFFKYVYTEELILTVPNSSFIVNSLVNTRRGI